MRFPRYAAAFAAAILCACAGTAFAQTTQEVGRYPTAGPLTGSERMLADQAGITVDILPTQITSYLASTNAILSLLPTPLVSTYCIGNNGTALQWVPCSGVASVGLTMPAGFSVTGSPLTSSGTLAVTTTLAGVLKGTGSGFTTAGYADVVGLFSGCTGSDYLGADGACHVSGGVTSVGLSVPAGLTVTGSPITGAGTLAITTDLSGPVKGTGTGFAPALAADIIGLWSGTCNSTTFLRADGTCQTAGGSGSGTVSSVGLSAPTWLTVTGSPVTTSGTLTLASTSEPANEVLASPAGASGALAPRALVSGDIPTSLPALTSASGLATVGTITTGTWDGSPVGAAYGGTGEAGTLTGLLRGNGTSAFTAATYPDVTALWSGTCSATTYLRGDGSCQTPAGTGTVTSVALSAPSVFAVSGSPITGAGTIAITFAGAQTANEFLATPNGTTGAVGLRAIVGADVPAINLAASGNGGVTGTLPAGSGGTGSAVVPAAGQIPVGNAGGTAYAPVAVSGDATLSSAGALTVTKTNGVAFGTFATQNYATPPAIGGTTPAAGAFTTLSSSGALTDTAAGAASAAAFSMTGAPYTAGTATTNFPLAYLNDGTAPTTWSTAGTELGFNAPSGFTGNFLDLHLNGGSSLFSVNYQGNVTGGTYNGSTVPASAGTLLGTGATASMASGFALNYGAGDINANQLLGNTIPTLATGYLNWTGTAWAFTTPSGSPVTLQTNGTNNASQSTLNIESGTGVTVTNPSAGNVLITASASAPTFDQIGTGLNTTAQMTCGGSCVIAPSTPTSGEVSANYINGIAVPANADMLGTDASATTFNVNPTGCLSYSSRQVYNLSAVYTESGAYTIGTNADDCALEIGTSATAQVFSLPPASGTFAANYTLNVQEYGTGGVTLTPLSIGLPTVGTPTATSGTGTLPSGTYYVTVSSVDGAGQTTVQAVQSVVLSSTGEVTVPITAGTNGSYNSSYNVWYSTSTFSGGSAAINYCVAAATAVSYSISAACSATATVPSSNTTASTINGLTTLAISTQYADAKLWSDGANWRATGTAVVSSGSSGITLENGGSSLGTITTFNCSTGTTCSASSGTGTITASGSGGTPVVANGWATGSTAAATTVYSVPGENGAAAFFALVPGAVTTATITYYQATASNASGSQTVITLYTGAPGSLTASTVTCSVPLGGRACSATGSVSIAANNAWQIQVANAGTTSTGVMSFGVQMH